MLCTLKLLSENSRLTYCRISGIFLSTNLSTRPKNSAEEPKSDPNLAENSQNSAENSHNSENLHNIRLNRKLSVTAWRKMRQSLINPDKFYVFSWQDAKSKDDSGLKMTFLFKDDRQQDKEIVLFRKPESPLIETFQRLSSKLSSLYVKPSKKSKKVKKSEKLEPEIEECHFPVEKFSVKNEQNLNLDVEKTSNFDAFLKLGKSFIVAEKVYKIEKQAPYFEKFKFDTRFFVNFPVFPSVDIVEDTFGHSVFHWFVEETEFLTTEKSEIKAFPFILDISRHENDNEKFKIAGFEYKSSGPFYVPSEKDVNKRICVIGIPKNSNATGIPNLFVSQSTVENSDEEMLWYERHQLCSQEPPNDRLRIVSYNILADLYLDLAKVPQEELWFPHCPAEYQHRTYRYPLLLGEISGYKADLLCLQEVDLRFNKRFLTPYFNNCGYKILYAKKARDVNEGSATVYNPQKLMHLHNFDMLVSDLLENNPGFEDLIEICKFNEENFEIFKTRPSALQVNVFRSLISGDQENLICICNLHLHSHPDHDHIRLWQISFCQRYLQKIVEKMKNDYPDVKNVGILLCGDLNSTPNSAVYESVSTGRIKADNLKWFPPSTEKDAPGKKGLDFQVPFALHNACPAQYTNFVGKDNFCGCLDYIFINLETLEVAKQFPMPKHELVEKYYGLPSKIAPSDHLPLICELKFK